MWGREVCLPLLDAPPPNRRALGGPHNLLRRGKRGGFKPGVAVTTGGVHAPVKCSRCTRPTDAPGLKRCSRCRIRGKRDNANYAKRHPGRVKEQQRFGFLVRLYGISRADFQRLLDSQGGRCAICRAMPTSRYRGCLRVDHDHKTKKVRGLLCDSCNLGLGKFGDSAARPAAAAEYLLMFANAPLYGKALTGGKP